MASATITKELEEIKGILNNVLSPYKTLKKQQREYVDFHGADRAIRTTGGASVTEGTPGFFEAPEHDPAAKLLKATRNLVDAELAKTEEDHVAQLQEARNVIEDQVYSDPKHVNAQSRTLNNTFCILRRDKDAYPMESYNVELQVLREKIGNIQKSTPDVAKIMLWLLLSATYSQDWDHISKFYDAMIPPEKFLKQHGLGSGGRINNTEEFRELQYVALRQAVDGVKSLLGSDNATNKGPLDDDNDE